MFKRRDTYAGLTKAEKEAIKRMVDVEEDYILNILMKYVR